MFSEISKNWAGRPLETFDTVVNLASRTTTKTGLRVDACLDQRAYQKGIKVSDQEMRDIKLTQSDILSKRNYTIAPRVQSQPKPEAIIPPSHIHHRPIRGTKRLVAAKM